MPGKAVGFKLPGVFGVRMTITEVERLSLVYRGMKTLNI